MKEEDDQIQLPVCSPYTKRRTPRAIWLNKIEYILSMTGYAVGLGNIWRFPYLVFKNGGGAFLVPYCVMFILSGMPLFFMESALGQFASVGPVLVWRMVPIVQGVGLTMIMISTLVSIYFNVIIAYSLFYLFASCRRRLPWAGCLDSAGNPCSKQLIEFCNWTIKRSNEDYSGRTPEIDNCTFAFPSKIYWKIHALQQSSGIDETGGVVWHLMLCNLLTWIFVGAAVFKGIKSSGKVIYFTSLFPYVVLLVLLVRGVTLEGAKIGLDYYVGGKSNFTKLWEAEVWKDAATQIFYSYCIGWGGLMTLSSYSKFRNNCITDTITVCAINAFTSFFAGFAIFSVLGHMSHVLDKPVSKVIDSGFYLAFVTYPDAVTHLPIAPFWSILFFLMLFTLGIDTQFVVLEIILTTIDDIYPGIIDRFRIVLTIGCCLILFLLGLPCVTQAGIFWVSLMDHYLSGWMLIIAAFVEVLAVSWIYGANRFVKDLQMMMGKKTWIYWIWWKACWYCISPVTIIVVFFWSVGTLSTPKLGSVVFPVWSVVLGWCLAIFCFIWIPLVASYHIYKADGTLLERIVKASKPSQKWGPHLHENRIGPYRCIEVTDSADSADSAEEIPAN